MVQSVERLVPQELIDAARGYENLFVPSLFQPWTGHLIDAADIRPGSHVLDVACGTGVVARAVLPRAGAKGRVVGADPAPGMLAVAAELEPKIEWLLCGAEALELANETFDCVIAQFGMMFFDDRRKSAGEMFRVLKRRGSLTVSVWNTVDHNPAYADVIAILEDQVGRAAADALRLPFSLGRAGEVTDLLEESGFVDIRTQTKVETARFPSTRHMVEAELRGWLPLFDIFLDEQRISAVLVESDRTLSRYVAQSGEAVFPTSAHLITARKP